MFNFLFEEVKYINKEQVFFTIIEYIYKEQVLVTNSWCYYCQSIPGPTYVNHNI